MNSKEKLLKIGLAINFYNENDEKDVLSLLIPHLKFCLGKNINIENRRVIDIHRLSDQMKDLLGYKNFTHLLTIEMLEKIKKEKIVVKEKNGKETRWVLIEKLDDFVKEYKEKEQKNIEEQEKFVVNVKSFFDEKKYNIKIEKEKIYDAILFYLYKHGFIVYSHIEEINLVKDNNNNEFDYCFTEYIKECYKNSSGNYNILLKIIEGFYVANAVSNFNDKYDKKNIENMECYFDTSIMLYILGLKQEDRNKAYKKVLDLYLSMGVKVKCLRNVVNELKNIVKNYSWTVDETRRLQYFDNNSMGEAGRILFVENIEKKIKENKIEIEDSGDAFNNYKRRLEIKQKLLQLKEAISEKVYYNKDAAIDSDVESVAYVIYRRGDIEISSFLNARSYFVTSNINLINSVNIFLGYDEKNKHLSPIVSDILLSNLIWLADMSIDNDFYSTKLISNAWQSNAVNERFVKKLESIIKCLSREEIGDFDIVTLLENNYIKNNMMNKTMGDEKKLNKEIVIEAIEKQKEKYKKEGYQNGIKEAREELEKEKQKKYDEGYNEARKKWNKRIEKEKEKHYEMGYNKAIEEMQEKYTQKQEEENENKKEKERSQIKKINEKYENKKSKDLKYINIIINIINVVVFFVLIIIYIYLYIKGEQIKKDLLSVCFYIFSIFLAINGIYSIFIWFTEKNHIIGFWIYKSVFEKSIDKKQNDEIKQIKQIFEF